jgi:L-asparaginase II
VTEPPVLVTFERAGVIESVHRGLLVIVDGSGQVVFAAGDPENADLSPVFGEAAAGGWHAGRWS